MTTLGSLYQATCVKIYFKVADTYFSKACVGVADTKSTCIKVFYIEISFFESTYVESVYIWHIIINCLRI